MTDIFPEIGNVEDCYEFSGPGSFWTPIRSIQISVCQKHGITIEEMLSHQRTKNLVKARHEAIRRAYHETSAGLTRIARAFDRDHTTIMYVVNK